MENSVTSARRFLLPLLVAALGSLWLLAPGASLADATSPCGAATGALDDEEQAFLVLLNEYRAAHGLPSLVASPSLNAAAAWHAEDMGQRNTFSHTDSLGRGPTERGADCGYSGGVGENIAAGTAWDTALEALEAWQNSPPHNDNLLGVGYRVLGVARAYGEGSSYGWYWVAEFGMEIAAIGLPAEPVEEPRAAKASAIEAAPPNGPHWVNDPTYGSAGGGFYWDRVSRQVWTAELGWHAFSRAVRGDRSEPLWVDDLSYGNAGGGFYLDPSSGLAWTAELGWHSR